MYSKIVVSIHSLKKYLSRKLQIYRNLAKITRSKCEIIVSLDVTFYHTFTKKKGCFAIEIRRKMNVPSFDPLSVDNLQVLRIAICLIQYGWKHICRWTYFKKDETRWCPKRPFYSFSFTNSCWCVYWNASYICAPDRHIYMLAIISRKTGKLVYTI